MKVNLQELANLVLCNLPLLEDDKLFARVVKDMKGTSIEHLGIVFDDAQKFRRDHGKYPDRGYIAKQHPDHFKDVNEPFSKDVFLFFASQIREEGATIRASEALAEGDVDGARSVLSAVKVDRKKEVYTSDKALEDYQEMKKRPAGIMAGVAEIDEVVKGFCYGTMNVIAAPPAHFKTTMGISIVYNAVFNNGFNWAMCSFELMARDMWFNFLSRHSLEMGMKIPAEAIKKSLLTPEQEKQLVEVADHWKANCKGKLRILTPGDFDGLEPAYLDQMFYGLAEEWGELDGVLLDYIQLCRFFRPPRVLADEFLNDLVRYFTNLSITFRKPKGLIVILLSQINREGEKKLYRKRRADKTSFAEINALERDAHTGLVLFSDAQQKLNNSLSVQVVKNRSGREMQDMVSVYVDPEAYLVGAQGYKDIFTPKSLSLLETEGDNMFA